MCRWRSCCSSDSADLERNTARAEAGLRAATCRRGTLRACVQQDDRATSRRAGRCRARGRSWRSCAPFVVRRTSSRPCRAMSRRRWPRRRPTTAPTGPTSTFPAPTTRTWPTSTTSPRRTRPGARANAPPTSPARRLCSTPACTRCGRAISCSSCTRTAIPPRSPPCGSATPTRKAGPITVRR